MPRGRGIYNPGAPQSPDDFYSMQAEDLSLAGMTPELEDQLFTGTGRLTERRPLFEVGPAKRSYQKLYTTTPEEAEYEGGNEPFAYYCDMTEKVDIVSLGQKVESAYRAAFNAPDRLQMVGNGLCDVAFYLGYQAREYAAAPGTIEGISNLLQRLKAEKNRIYFTENLFAELVRIMLSQRTFKRPMPLIQPNNQTQEARYTARSMVNFLNWYWDDQRLDVQRMRSAWWRLMCGTSCLKVIRNKRGGRQRRVGGKVVVEPEINVIPLRPSEWAVNPDARRPEDVREVFHVTMRTEEQVLTKWGDRLKKLTGHKAVPYNAIEYVDTVAAGLFKVESGVQMFPQEINSGDPLPKRAVAVLENWLLPTYEFPTGLVVTCIGSQVVQVVTPPNEYLAFMWSREEDTDASFYGHTPLNDIRNHAVSRNQLLAQVLDTLEKHKPRKLKSRIEAATSAAAITAQPDESKDEVLQEDTEDVEFYYGQPPMISEWPKMPVIIKYLMDFFEFRMRNRTGAHESSNFQVPAGASTATHMLSLKEESDMRLAPVIKDDQAQWKQTLKYVLMLGRSVYPEEKLIKVIGDDKRLYLDIFKAADIPDEFDVDFIADSISPSSRALRHAQLQDITSMAKAFNFTLSKAEVFQLVEFPGWEVLLQQQHIDEQNALEEERMFEQGVFRAPMQFDDHAAHIHFHVLQAKFRSLEASDAEHAMRVKHIQEHQRYLQPPTAAEAALPGAAPSGAGMPPGMSQLMGRMGMMGAMGFGGKGNGRIAA